MVGMNQHDLVRLLSPARLAPYRATCGGDWQQVIVLYDWNTRISAAFFESLHYLEVGLRNAFDNAIASVFGSHWMAAGGGLLTSQTMNSIAQARRHAGGSDALHGKVVAELPFGFWWSLLADEYNRGLWQPALRFAFEGPVRRRRAHLELDELRRLRNRIAHHEPIHSRDLKADYARILDLSGRLAPALADHIALTSRIPALLDSTPGLRGGPH